MDENKIIRLEVLYRQHLQKWNYQVDPAQLEVVSAMQSLLNNLSVRPQKNIWANCLMLKRKHRIEQASAKYGLYLWGDVGRGKSFMVNFLYEILPVNKKRRLHYYQFMQEIHASLKEANNQRNPLRRVAKRLTERAHALFLDEFFVSDIVDAMILHRLLAALFDHQIVFVVTSNFAPSELYKDGLQRERFLPAIALIERYTEVVEIAAGVDYRTRYIKSSGSYYSPCNEKSEYLMQQCFIALSAENPSDTNAIKINNRYIKIISGTPNVVWFDFKEICQTPRGVSDYILIAHLYHVVLISKVPIFKRRDDAARRFIQLVDEFYDQNIMLVLSAQAPPHKLYQNGNLQFEFSRTASRLREMQSPQYWERRPLPAKHRYP